MTDHDKVQSTDHPPTQHQSTTQQGSSTKQPSQQPSQNMESNGAISREERHARRRKISRSASASSSLSSLPSTEDREFSPTFESNRPGSSKDQAPTQPLQGSKSHALSTKKHPNSKKRPAPPVSTNPDDSANESAAKRQKLQKTFDDYKFFESEIRTRMPSKKPTQTPSLTTNLTTGPAQQTRSHNSVSQGTRKDDNDDARSPGSSTQGELLIPPPAGARSSSRGVTPNPLGRPAKQLRKAARVKMS